ncbi:MAG: PadR family transcriptional regulator, partial [Longimicrobiales bacterium]
LRPTAIHPTYVTPTYGVAMLSAELKKGTIPLLVLSLLDAEPRHGYELSKLIEAQSRGVVRVHAASLYPLLYRLEKRKWIEGRWVEKPDQRRRRFYRLTPLGRRQLTQQRESWMEFARAVSRVAGVEYA